MTGECLDKGRDVLLPEGALTFVPIAGKQITARRRNNRMRHSTQRKTANQEFPFTNRLVASMIACGLTFLIPHTALGGSAMWDLNPGSGVWNTTANLESSAVRNGPRDIVMFGLSNAANVVTSEDSQVDGIILSSAATNPYTITVARVEGLTLTISGVGIKNNSSPWFASGPAGDLDNDIFVFWNGSLIELSTE